MCGLAGIFAYGTDSAPVEVPELERMCASMAARGPDGQGVWLDPTGRLGLGHRRLSILDLSSAGAQPMVSVDGDVVVVLNGEIYNHLELRALLKARGHQFRSGSDTETLLAMYREYGEDLLPLLRGMFAFGIWQHSTQTLLLGRDPLGIKPLYVADDGRTLRFASQVKALRAGGGFQTTDDPAGRVGFMIWGSVPEPFTSYREISAVPAGTSLRLVRGGRATSRRYVDLTQLVVEAQDRPSGLNAEQSHHLVRQACRESVRAHMLSDVPVAVFLSAGVDSAAVLGIAAEGSGEKPGALTLEFAEFLGKHADESPGATRVAAHYGSPHVIGRVEADDFLSALPHLRESMDQPTIDGVNSYFVSRLARRHGWKVALSGVGSDEFTGGYGHFQDIPSMVQVLKHLRFAKGLGPVIRRLAAPLVRRFNSPKYASIFEYGSSVAGAYLLRRSLFLPWELPALMDPELAAQGLERLALHDALDRTVQGVKGIFPALMLLEMNWYLRNQLLRDADWAGMAHSIEIRTPLVDYTLFETLLPLYSSPTPPAKFDIAASPLKPIPDDVLNRRKTGFAVPVQDWITGNAHNPFRDPGLRGYARFLLTT